MDSEKYIIEGDALKTSKNGLYGNEFPDFFFFLYLLVKESPNPRTMLWRQMEKKIKQKPSFWLEDLK